MNLLNKAKRDLQAETIRRFVGDRKDVIALCLPGITGFDARVLLQYANVVKVFCVERDREISDSLGLMFYGEPRAEVVNSTVSDFLTNHAGRVDIFLLDYFSNLGRNIINDLNLISTKAATGADVSLNFLGARETEEINLVYDIVLSNKIDVSGLSNDKKRVLVFSHILNSINSNSKGIFFTEPSFFFYETEKARMITANFKTSDVLPPDTFVSTKILDYKRCGTRHFTSESLHSFVVGASATRKYLTYEERSTAIKDGLKKTKKKLGRPTKYNKREVLRLLSSGLSYSQIYKKIGVPKSVISKIVNKEKICRV